jgi:rRNA maturation endonuclease Nob1
MRGKMMGRYNEDFLDAISLVSFMIGMANYGENLSQSDKDDMMQALDRKTNEMLMRLEDDLEVQNQMLKQQNEMLAEIKTAIKEAKGDNK